MGRAKEIELKVIPSKIAVPFVKAHHYSGKVVNNSNLHFGAFLDGRLHGVMSFGSPMDKRKVLGLVEGTGWNEMIELNRMAFDEYLPRNSESYCIGKALRMIKKNAPQIKWILSFADGCSCGDGTIYRASNFILTGIKKNKEIILLPDGSKIAKLSLHTSANDPRKELNGKSFSEVSGGGYSMDAYLKASGGKFASGFMLRYIYFIDKKSRDKLTVPVIPFSKIDELHAGMYKGEQITQAERHAKT
jgi:hypothetical protein